jgi:predicted DNA-binding mobile mystery protein A
MSKFKSLQIQNLDRQFKSFSLMSKPKNGWIRTIRSAMFMPLGFLANRMNVSPQAISGFEKNEIDDTITLKTLRHVAQAMNCQLHYALIPKDKSLLKLLEDQAHLKACKIVDEVDKSMSLEDQRVKDSSKSIKAMTKALAKELAKNPNKKLWSL